MQLSIDVFMCITHAILKLIGAMGLAFGIYFLLGKVGIHLGIPATALIGLGILYTHSLYVDIRQQVIWTMNTHAHLEMEKGWIKLTTEEILPKPVTTPKPIVPVKAIAPPKKPTPPSWFPILPGEE